jgi:hypothetical protein
LFNSIAKRAAASFRRSALDCWLLVSRSPRPPSQPAAAEEVVGAAAAEVAAAVARELVAVAPELVQAVAAVGVQAVAAVGVRAAVVQRFTG